MSNIVSQVEQVGATFTSWDSCMSKTYCKWPVIAAIIVAALIVLSILWCVFSCLCCGISLCTACAQCLTCGKCCGACGSSRGRRRDPEYHAMPPTPNPYQGYQPQPMMYVNAAPQFATFDASGNKRSANIHEDSLPAMPSWETSASRRVEDTTPAPPPPQQQQQRTRNDMEMERMLPYGHTQGPRSPTDDSPYDQYPHQNQRTNQVPTSPIHNPHYTSDPYTSDLGAQQHSTHGYNHNSGNDYYDPPMSPAPTYYSTAPAGPPSRIMSPQHTYDTSYHGPTSPAPYPSSRESTQFGSGYTNSPYYQSQQQQQPLQPQESGVRPPSLLQIGRKPVAGSFREV